MKLEYRSIKDNGNGRGWYEFHRHSLPVRPEDFTYVTFRFEIGGKEYTEYNEEFKQQLAWATLSNTND